MSTHAPSRPIGCPHGCPVDQHADDCGIDAFIEYISANQARLDAKGERWSRRDRWQRYWLGEILGGAQ